MLYSIKRSPRIVGLSILCLANSQSLCQKVSSFDTKGFPATKKGLYGQSDQLLLLGVGMRKKNIVIMKVDVYLCAISLSSSALQEAVAWKQVDNMKSSLADILLKKKSSTNQKETNVQITIKFQRSVTKAQMNEAFEVALEGCDIQSVKNFSEEMTKACPDDFKQGDELIFSWPKSGGLVLSSESYTSSGINDEVLAKRFLEVYIDDVRSVSPDLISNIKENVDKVIV